MNVTWVDYVIDQGDCDQVRDQEPGNDCAYGAVGCGELFLIIVSHGDWVSIPVELLEAFLSALPRPFTCIAIRVTITKHNLIRFSKKYSKFF